MSTLEDNLWSSKLNRAQFVVGPMVDQSELSFRLLCRKYGAQLCYTPMLNAGIFVKDAKYRKENLVTCSQDRPLIVQFCANDPEIFLQAARLAVPYCDAVDLNLGCPQTIAKRGHYGAFLEDEWQLLSSIISKVAKELNFPVTCKIRIFSDLDKTIRYAKMLEQAGCRLLAVHGRIKEQKGVLTGLANWPYIKAIKENVQIPVFANGNIQSLSDVFNCLHETGVDGIMSAEGALYNPALFLGIHPHVCIVAEEYMEFDRLYPSALSIVRGHLFKIFHIALSIEENYDMRNMLAKANVRQQFHQFVQLMRKRYESDETLEEGIPMSTLPLPPYLCQPHFRPLQVKTAEGDETGKKRRNSCENDPTKSSLSKRMVRKAINSTKDSSATIKSNGRKLPLCTLCPNPKGVKCDYNLCRACCRDKVYKMVLDCEGHKLLFKTRKQLMKDRENDSKKGIVPHPSATLA